MAFRKLSAILGLSVAFAAPAFAQSVELIPRASFFGNPTRAQGLISPDGQWLSWLALPKAPG